MVCYRELCDAGGVMRQGSVILLRPGLTGGIHSAMRRLFAIGLIALLSWPVVGLSLIHI